MTFLVNGETKENGVLILKYTQKALWPMIVLYPWWIWFRVGSRAAMMGGKVTLISFLDFITSGPLQLAWLALVFGPMANQGAGLSFPVAYIIFFLSDIPRGIIFEICFYKMHWAHSITVQEEDINMILGANDVEFVEKETFTK
jgi:Na+-driven multidrug efflux pump